MALWRYVIGNLARRAPAVPVAVSPALEDTELPLANLADDYPDTLGGLQWRSDGAYDIDFDLNLLAGSSQRADAPTGWADLLNYLAGTLGLPANPPDWGSYGGRNPALRFFRPSYQDIAVMPGEKLQLNVGLYRPTGASGSTGTRVTVTDLESGKSWDGAAWTTGGVVATQATVDTWLDVQEEILPDASRTERTLYRVVLAPLAASYGPTTYGYGSLYLGAGEPALIAEADTTAIVQHNVPDGATVVLGAIAMTPAQPSFFTVGTSVYTRVWRLSVDMPAGNNVRPILGEVWVGKMREFERSPQLPLALTESDPSQVRLEGSRGRLEVIASEGLPPARLKLDWAVPDTDYVRLRDELLRLTRFGGEPMLLVPSTAFEGARFYHGRLGQEVSYSRMTAAESTEAWRSLTVDFQESPMASP